MKADAAPSTEATAVHTAARAFRDEDSNIATWVATMKSSDTSEIDATAGFRIATRLALHHSQAAFKAAISPKSAKATVAIFDGAGMSVSIIIRI
jgi:hypothetical protein